MKFKTILNRREDKEKKSLKQRNQKTKSKLLDLKPDRINNYINLNELVQLKSRDQGLGFLKKQDPTIHSLKGMQFIKTQTDLKKKAGKYSVKTARIVQLPVCYYWQRKESSRQRMSSEMKLLRNNKRVNLIESW